MYMEEEEEEVKKQLKQRSEEAIIRPARTKRANGIIRLQLHNVESSEENELARR